MNKHCIKICMGSSCFARGNMNNLNFLENYIKENNLDINVELVGSHCENKCENGPHVCIDDKSFDEVDEEKLKNILESLK